MNEHKINNKCIHGLIGIHDSFPNIKQVQPIVPLKGEKCHNYSSADSPDTIAVYLSWGMVNRKEIQKLTYLPQGPRSLILKIFNKVYSVPSLNNNNTHDLQLQAQLKL